MESAKVSFSKRVREIRDPGKEGMLTPQRESNWSKKLKKFDSRQFGTRLGNSLHAKFLCRKRFH